MKKKTLEVKGEEDLAAFADTLAKKLQPGILIGLIGELGSGKTTFVRHLVTALQPAAAAAVHSPTFSLIHEYPTRPPLIHIDLYRLGDSGPDPLRAALDGIGFRDYLTQGNIVVIEWFDLLPENDRQANFTLTFYFGEKATHRTLVMEEV